MLRIPIENAIPGMVVGVPVFHPERSGTTLLNAGVRLTDQSLTHLRRLPIASLWIDHPRFRMIDRFIQPSLFRLMDELRGRCPELIDTLADSQSLHWAGQADAERLLTRLVQETRPQQDPIAFLDDPPPRECPAQIAHATSTCLLSVLLSVQLHSYIQRQRRKSNKSRVNEIVDLSLGALVHDIGLRRIHPDAFDRWMETGAEDDPRWQAHARLGYELVNGRIDATAATVVLHHHQYFNHTGFPKKTDWDGRVQHIGGDEVHIFARIVMAADQFDELKHHPDGTVWPNVRALRHFLTDSTISRLDPVVATAIFQVVPAYVPGSMVTLSSGDIGFVIDWKPGNPCRPMVALLSSFDQLIGPEDHHHVEAEDTTMDSAAGPASEPVRQADVHRLDETFRLINLARTPGLHIVECQGHEVAEDNFSLPHEFRPVSRAGMPFDELEAA